MKIATRILVLAGRDRQKLPDQGSAEVYRLANEVWDAFFQSWRGGVALSDAWLVGAVGLMMALGYPARGPIVGLERRLVKRKFPACVFSRGRHFLENR